MTGRAAERARRRAHGHQLALALLRLGHTPGAADGQLELIRSAAEDEIVLTSLISGLLGFTEKLATTYMGTAQWETWLADQIAQLALQQTEGH